EYRAGLALPEIFLADLTTVLARRHPQAHAVRSVDHRAVGAAVHPVLFGVAHDDEIVGSQIAPAVLLVQQRRRELQDIDIAFYYVLQNRALPDCPGGESLVRL